MTLLRQIALVLTIIIIIIGILGDFILSILFKPNNNPKYSETFENISLDLDEFLDDRPDKFKEAMSDRFKDDILILDYIQKMEEDNEYVITNTDDSDLIWPTIGDLYSYLDTLNLLEFSALFHIVVLITILIIGFNILSVLMGNEIIKYFNLEEKYPKLAIFFQLRLKYQRYYILTHMFLLFIICIVVILINILVLY